MAMRQYSMQLKQIIINQDNRNAMEINEQTGSKLAIVLPYLMCENRGEIVHSWMMIPNDL